MQKAGDRSDQFADGDRRTSAHVEGSVGPGVNERGKRFAKIRRMNKIPHLVLRHTERVALTVKGCDQTRYKFFFGLARPIREEDAAPGEAAGMGGTDLPADLVKPMSDALARPYSESGAAGVSISRHADAAIPYSAQLPAMATCRPPAPQNARIKFSLASDQRLFSTESQYAPGAVNHAR